MGWASFAAFIVVSALLVGPAGAIVILIVSLVGGVAVVGLSVLVGWLGSLVRQR